MTIGTLFRYLIGERQAILDVASTRKALLLGLLFVFSAALAREYDGKDLLGEPWHLVIPLGASLGTSFLLYGLVFLIAKIRRVRDITFRETYPRFLALYWMTAPLAWLYAIPVERFLSPADATKANLALLGLVATWRVALMTRVISVLFRCRVVAAFFLVMLFADAVVLVILNTTRLPIFDIMGGIRHTKSEQVILDTACLVCFWGFVSIPVWLIGTAVVAWPRKSPWGFALTAVIESGTISRPLWALGVAAILGWALVLPATQSEQRLRARVERDLLAGRVEAAIMEMSRHAPGDFPPQWDPPPRPGYGERLPDVLEVMEVITNRNPAPWVRQIYLEKLKAALPWSRFYPERPPSMTRLAKLLTRIPEGPEIAAGLCSQLDHWDLEENLSESDRQARLTLRKLGQCEKPPPSTITVPGAAAHP